MQQSKKINLTKNSQSMFTIEQLRETHSKVKSGADFPAYIHEIKKLGVVYYETFVKDGHTDYYGSQDYRLTSPAKYDARQIADECNKAQFKTDLKEHQLGKTDYLTFTSASAKLGIEKWRVCMDKMTCTYYDKTGNEILVEEIPH